MPVPSAKRNAGRIAAALLSALAALTSTPSPRAAADDGPPREASASEQQRDEVARLVGDLASPIYRRREIATAKLKGQGRTAVRPVEAAVLEGELEVAIRGIAILEGLAVDDDGRTADAAAEALERLKNSPNPSVAWRSKRALKFIDRWAYLAIESLGGRVNVQPGDDGDSVAQIKLDGVPGRKLSPFQRRALKRFPVLVVAGGEIDDDDIAFLEDLDGLRHLDVRYTKVGDKGLTHLRKLTDLRKLMLSGTQLGDAGLQIVAGLPELRVLYLSSTKISDTGLARLTPLKHLTEVNLSQCKGVTDAGMAHLARMASLEEINLTGTRVSDAGLQKLAAMRQLEQLHLHGTLVTDEGVERLHQALPECRIKH